jgi:hypothetical protein
MRVSELLNAVASWLENSNNEAMLLAEQNDDCLEATAEVCLAAARLIREGSLKIDAVEPETCLASESIDSLTELAAALDASGDESLTRTASVLDELLLTIASSAEELNNLRAERAKTLDELKLHYSAPGEYIAKADKREQTEKAIKDSDIGGKQYISMEAPLSTRTCPDHYGTPVSRVGEDTYACPLDNKVYDYRNGFTNMKGDKIPGGSVANQTQLQLNPQGEAAFDNRESRLARDK